jgi:hypothetical protein
VGPEEFEGGSEDLEQLVRRRTHRQQSANATERLAMKNGVLSRSIIERLFDSTRRAGWASPGKGLGGLSVGVLRGGNHFWLP